MGKHNDRLESIDAEHLAPLIEDDAFLTALSRGNNPTDSGDPLAELFLDLRAEVEAPMPAAPLVEGGDAEIYELDVVGTRSGPSPWATGLIGIAAGIVLVAGAGTVVNSAGPDSPLYPVRTAMFGDEDMRVVELASTLDELEHKTNNGDIDGAKELISQARKQLDKAGTKDAPRVKTPVKVTQTTTVTVTVTAVPPAAEPTETTTQVAPAPVMTAEAIPAPAPVVTQQQVIPTTTAVEVTETPETEEPVEESPTPEPEVPVAPPENPVPPVFGLFQPPPPPPAPEVLEEPEQ